MKYLILYALAAALSLLGACRKSVDPCANKPPLKADFQILENNVNESDTINMVAGFRALTEADSYEWRIGNDPMIHRDKSFTLGFINAQDQREYKVQLIVRRENDPCSPKLADTLTKFFYLDNIRSASEIFNSQIYGSFIGEYSHEPGVKRVLKTSHIFKKVSTGTTLSGWMIDSIFTFSGLYPYEYCQWTPSRTFNGYGRTYFLVVSSPVVSDRTKCSLGRTGSSEGLAYIDYKTKRLIVEYDWREGDPTKTSKFRFVGEKIK